MSSATPLNPVQMSPIPISSADETVPDNDDVNLLIRMLDRAGYDQAAEPKLFGHAAAQLLSLFDSGIRHETILMAALQNPGDYPGVADPFVKRRFAIQGLPPGNTAPAV